MTRSLVVTASLLLSASFVSAETVLFQPRPHLGEDLHISSSAGASAAIAAHMFVSLSGSNEYWSLIRVSDEGLPANPDFVAFYFWNDSSILADYDLWLLTAPNWSESSITWEDRGQLRGYNLGAFPAQYGWNGFDITSIYGLWKNGSIPNRGFALLPRYGSDGWEQIRTSDYPVSSDVTRPVFLIQGTPPSESPFVVPSFHSPLPACKHWLLTTEVGGTDCLTSIDPFHTGAKYFSLDFAPCYRGTPNGTTTCVSESTEVPIYPVGPGIVTSAGYTSANGYYVVIDHDYDNDVTTGFQTHYIHLASSPNVHQFDIVGPSTKLGNMGNTGISHGRHLHISFKHADNGSATNQHLTWLKMEGQPLRQYMTECSDGARTQHYPSTYPRACFPSGLQEEQDDTLRVTSSQQVPWGTDRTDMLLHQLPDMPTALRKQAQPLHTSLK